MGLIGSCPPYPALGGVIGPVVDGSEVAVQEGDGVLRE